VLLSGGFTNIRQGFSLKKLQLPFGGGPIREEKQPRELRWGQYLSHFLNEVIEQMPRLFDLLLLPQNLARASQDLPALEGDAVALLIEEAIVAILHEVRLHELPPIIYTISVETVKRRPEDEPVDVGQVSIDEALIQDVEYRPTLTPR
jgi:hypothetical protein